MKWDQVLRFDPDKLVKMWNLGEWQLNSFVMKLWNLKIRRRKKVVKFRNVEAVKIIQPTIGEQQEKGNWVSNPINLFRDAFNWVQLGLLRAKIKTF